MMLQCFLIVLAISTSSQNKAALNYTEHLIKFFANKPFGHFHCWIYDLEHPGDDFINNLLTSPTLQTTSHLVLTSTSTSAVSLDTFPDIPSLIIIHCRVCDRRLTWEHLTFHRVPTETKIFIVHRCPNRNLLSDLLELFDELGLINTVLLDLNTNTMHYLLVYFWRAVEIRNLRVPPGALFVDQTRDLNGYQVTVSCYWQRPEVTFVERHKVQGRDAQWIESSAEFLNGSMIFVDIDCDRSRVSPEECEFRRKFISRNRRFDMNLDLTHDDQMKPFFIDSVEPDREVIMVPRGAKLSALELFIAPFHVYVWLTLSFVIVGCWMVVFYYSDFIVNDPILAALCGIEQISFYQTNRVEKLLIIALTVLFFFLLRAYETKIIALMTSYPYKRDPRTPDDLRRLGVKIRYYEGFSNYSFQHNPELWDLVVTLPPNTTNTPVYASIGEETQVSMIMSMTNHFYARGDRPKFVLLRDYQLGLAIRQFYMAPRSPLAQKFKWTQRVFFEAGLRRFWMDQVMHIYRVRSRLIAVREGDEDSEEDDDELQMHEMDPAWYVIVIGLFCSGITCLGEVVWKKCCQNYSDKRHEFQHE